MCAADSCGFCRFLAHLISVGVYRLVFAVLLTMNMVSLATARAHATPRSARPRPSSHAMRPETAGAGVLLDVPEHGRPRRDALQVCE